MGLPVGGLNEAKQAFDLRKKYGELECERHGMRRWEWYTNERWKIKGWRKKEHLDGHLTAPFALLSFMKQIAKGFVFLGLFNNAFLPPVRFYIFFLDKKTNCYPKEEEEEDQIQES